MPLVLNRVHDYERGPANTVIMKRVSPAVRVRFARDEPPIFIQNGGFYGEGGQEIRRQDLPEDFWKEAARLTERTRLECGLVLPDGCVDPTVRTAEAGVRPRKAGKFTKVAQEPVAGTPQAGPQDEVAVLRSDMKQLAGTVDKLVGAVNHLLEERAAKPTKGKKRRAAA